MMGFAVSTSAVLLTAWIVHVVSYRVGRSEGIKVGQIIGRASVLYPGSVPDRFKGVPAGTHPECTTDPNCPLQQSRAAHVARDNEIYGRNG